MHGLKKKEDGAGIMISGTIVDNMGLITGDQDDIDKVQDLRRERCRISAAKHAAGDPTEPEAYRDIHTLYKDNVGTFWTYYKFEYGKNKEGYWTGAKMVQHMADVLDLPAVRFLTYKPVCFFDWSSCHDCVEEGAPSISRMNSGCGGVRKGVVLAAQDSVILQADTPKLKKGQLQHLTFQDGEVPFYAPNATDNVGKVKVLKQSCSRGDFSFRG